MESAQDVLEELGMSVQTSIHPNKSGSSDSFLQHMGYDPCAVDVLVARTGLTAAAVSAMLLELELDAKVSSLPGGLYQRLA